MDDEERDEPGGAPTRDRGRRGRRWVWVAGAAALVIAGGGAAAGLSVASAAGPAAPPARSCGSGAPKLTVRGTGQASGTPNLLTLTLGVDTSGTSAESALGADNTSTAAVVAALSAGGVKKKDVQTTGLSIQPTYSKTGTPTGYSVDNTVVAEITDFATAGTVIDSAASAAGNAVRISGLSFSVEDPAGLQDQARQDAVHQAVSHAATMAAAAGDHLGPVCTLSDNSSGATPTGGFRSAEGFASAGAAEPARVPVEAGSQRATAEVTLVYALLPGPAGRR